MSSDSEFYRFTDADILEAKGCDNGKSDLERKALQEELATLKSTHQRSQLDLRNANAQINKLHADLGNVKSKLSGLTDRMEKLRVPFIDSDFRTVLTVVLIAILLALVSIAYSIPHRKQDPKMMTGTWAFRSGPISLEVDDYSFAEADGDDEPKRYTLGVPDEDFNFKCIDMRIVKIELDSAKIVSDYMMCGEQLCKRIYQHGQIIASARFDRASYYPAWKSWYDIILESFMIF